MASSPDAPCLSELSGFPNRNFSLIYGTRPCNRSTGRSSSSSSSPYSPQATAAFAIAITSMMLLTIVGNILVIIAVLTSRSLKGPQNLFLVSLAAADILVATLIIPFSLANELQGYWAFSSVWCEIYLALDVLFCTSSIVHLCAIALDRYLSISRPITYGAKRTPTRIKAAIIIVWLISAVISFPPLLSLDKSKGGEEGLRAEQRAMVYSLLHHRLLLRPLCDYDLVYVRIYQIAKQHTRSSAGQKQKATTGENANESPAKISEQNGDQGGSHGKKSKLKSLALIQTSRLSETLQRIRQSKTLQSPKSPNPSAVPQKESQKHQEEEEAAFENSSNSGSEMADEGKDETDKSETLGSSRKKGSKSRC
ncbi:Alpha-2B adrenergic receptor [Dissostichus eleginoides]|uniref:Alpha-2B adrenergic receptor n=1 Tax=Dissostichus eleginoides TaxID=100907 RepID=A0AAD9BK63_DISEL|nr:Alpha-2B adrenergic receptor [Dissostichus eleginoides]